jgi:glutaredoxin-like protein NrdH
MSRDAGSLIRTGVEMLDAKGRVNGAGPERSVTFFGLSTCAWCKKTRAFLEAQGIGFDFFYVDLLEGSERDRVVADLARHNPRMNFPTVVIDAEVIVGYDPEALRRALEL